MKTLVTGGAGFIGSNFIRYMMQEHPEDDYVNLDLLTYAGHLETIEDLEGQKGYQFIKGDIADKAFIDELFRTQQFDRVVNFAAESHVDRSVTGPEIFIHTNIVGTQVLLEACRKYGIKRYHQVSTDEVYGDLPLDRKDLFFTEHTPLNPSSPYSASKTSADLLVLAYHRTYHMPVTISRCSNNYGPYHFPEKLIPLTFIKAFEDQPIPVYGNGLNVRDWLYVEDHCRAIDLILQKGVEGEVYNVGGHSEKTNLEVIQVLLETLHKPESLMTYVTDRPGHDLRYAIDPKKIEETLGWKPLYTFEEGMQKTIDWYLSNEKWWRTVLK